MHKLARVLLDVDARDTDLFFSHLGLHGKRAALANGPVKLADLVCFGKIGIKVVLSVKAAAVVHMAVQRHTRHGGVAQNLLVEYRKRAGQTHAHGANVRVRLRAEGVWTGAKNLASGAQLHVRFQADNHFVDGLFAHLASLPS